ncbi:carbonic anhydrase [Hyalangium gracile]|uniref:carbonic anhydrase n=1 Tax=Hyalangium gracile TaxID=394092 RepID=UPI001CC94651|nr:carbonic anhydrase [Hyalangium gracile]
MPTLTAQEALEKLKVGNARFASNVLSAESLLSNLRRAEFAQGQQPWAVILGCSDSRVPAETVFDVGLGELFVIRVAGNIVAPSQVGSVEFSVERHGARLVVVMGHTLCGAIDATLEAMTEPPSKQSPGLRSIVERVRPSVVPLLHTELAHQPAALRREATRANVRASVSALRHGSQLLEKLVYEDGLLVVGAEYDLVSGRVEFFEGVPE